MVYFEWRLEGLGVVAVSVRGPTGPGMPFAAVAPVLAACPGFSEGDVVGEADVRVTPFTPDGEVVDLSDRAEQAPRGG